MINEFKFYMFIKNVSQVFTFFLLPDAQFTNYLITLNSFEKLSIFLFPNFVANAFTIPIMIHKSLVQDYHKDSSIHRHRLLGLK